MPTSGKADPAIYAKLRDAALRMRLPRPTARRGPCRSDGLARCSGTATVLAAVDGTASIYLDSGGGFIGGSQGHPEIHTAALFAMQVANGLMRFSTPVDAAESAPLPVSPDVFFYFVTAEGLRRITATFTQLQTGGMPFVLLGIAMQKIVTEYRATQQA